MHLVIARYAVKAGMTEEVVDLLAGLTAASRREEGNLSYNFYRVEGEDAIVLVERYSSAEAFAAHCESEHFRTILLGEVVPRLESREVTAVPATEY
ncbi:MAG TPA: putative quinol monooxygenase, partial [Microbacteriaceae bacterium]|nr:putative quinol monooxygenase [Microbacteriaceae bacterium]